MVWSVVSMVLVTVGFVALLAFVPFNRWIFQHQGRRIEVRNFGLTESVRVDGVVVPESRVAGDFVSFATHAIPFSNGESLIIEITTSTFAMRCLARLGTRVVFDSIGQPATLPLVDDPRWEAAQTLLSELDDHPSTARSAATLRRVLERGFLSLSKTRRLAEAHRTLGSDDLGNAVAQHERKVRDALELLRQLHLAAHRPRRAPTAKPSTSSVSTPRTSTMRSADRAQLDKVSRTLTGSP